MTGHGKIKTLKERGKKSRHYSGGTKGQWDEKMKNPNFYNLFPWKNRTCINTFINIDEGGRKRNKKRWRKSQLSNTHD